MTAEAYINPERLEYARILRDQGFGWRSIVTKTGISLYLLRVHLIPGYREHKREIARKAEERRPRALRRHRARKKQENEPRGISGRFERQKEHRLDIPDDVLADCKHRYELKMAREDFTANLLGDPLPGYSALERR